MNRDPNYLAPFEPSAALITSVHQRRAAAIDWSNAPVEATGYAIRYNHYTGRTEARWVVNGDDLRPSQFPEAPVFFELDVSDRGTTIRITWEQSLLAKQTFAAAGAEVAAGTAAPEGIRVHTSPAPLPEFDPESLEMAVPGTSLRAGEQPSDVDQAALLELRQMGYSLDEAKQALAQAKADEAMFPVTYGEAGEGLPEAEAQEERAGYFYRNHQTPQQAFDAATKLGEQRHMRLMGVARAALATERLSRIAQDNHNNIRGYRNGLVDGRAEILAIIDPRSMTFAQRLVAAKRFLAGQPLLPELEVAKVTEGADAPAGE